MTALVFADTETTGLDPERDEVWEFAAIRREPDGSGTTWHAFVDHDAWRRMHLPDAFAADLVARYDPTAAIGQGKFSALLADVFRDKPRIVGAAPWFDAGMLARYINPCWSHRLVDVETLAAGRLGRLVNGLSDAAAAFGIENPAAHTAMGDTQTAMRVYDAVMGGGR